PQVLALPVGIGCDLARVGVCQALHAGPFAALAGSVARPVAAQRLPSPHTGLLLPLADGVLLGVAARVLAPVAGPRQDALTDSRPVRRVAFPVLRLDRHPSLPQSLTQAGD